MLNTSGTDNFPLSFIWTRIVFFFSVVQSWLDCNTLGFPVLHHLLKIVQTHTHWISDVIQPSRLCHPLLLLLSNIPSIRVFSNESVHIRWPKYWSFSFSISPSNEYLGLFSFKVDWFDLLAVQRTLKRQWYLSHRMSLEALCFNVLNSLRRICV